MTTKHVTPTPVPVALKTGPPEATPEALRKAARKRKRTKILLALLVVLLLLFALVFGWYLTTRKPLSQLPGLANDNMPHYVSSFYGSARPMGVAVSPAGNRIYVTESDGARAVNIYDRTGKKLGALQPPKTKTAASQPVYVAVDPVTGDVYVSDRPQQKLHIYGANGVYKRAFVPRGDLGGGWQPLGVAFDKSGDLYVTDVSGKTHRVLQFGRDGALKSTLGVANKLTFPNGLAIDPQGTAYVSDSNNGRLVTFDPAKKFASAVSRGVGEGDLGMPRGVALDSSGRLYVVDTSAHAVKVYRTAAGKVPSAKYIGTFGEEGQIDGTFEYPNGVATDARGRIYVTDRENNRVQVWSH